MFKIEQMATTAQGNDEDVGSSDGGDDGCRREHFVGTYKRGGREQSVWARAVCVRGKAEMWVAISPLPLGIGAGRVQDLPSSHCLVREPAISDALRLRGAREVLRNMLGSGVVGYGGCKGMGWECELCLP